MDSNGVQLTSKHFLSLHSSHYPAIYNVMTFILFMTLIVIISPFIPPIIENQNYLPLHTVLETSSLIIAMLIFAVGWNSYGHTLPANIAILSTLFFGVAVFDFSHILSYAGMPDFITPSSVEKGIDFWLAARLLSSLGLVLFFYLPVRQLSSKLYNYLFLGVIFFLLGIVHWLILYKYDLFSPLFFLPDQGLTPLKIGIEYLIIFLNLISALVLLRRMRTPQPYYASALLGAFCMMSLSEFFFTLYTHETDLYNILGHIYKTIAYLFIYRAIFAATIEKPYKNLYDSERELQNKTLLLDSIIENIPNMIFLKDAKELRFKLFNKAGETLLGLNRNDLLNRNDYDLFPKEQADFFIREDRKTLKSDTLLDILEETIETPRGTRILHTKKIALKDTQGEVHYLLGISEDITDKKSAEKALLNSEHSLKESQIIAGLGSYTLDILTGRWKSSEILDQLLGIDHDYERSVAGWEAIVHPDDRLRMSHYLRDEVIDKGAPFSQEYRIIRHNDQCVRWVHGLGKLLFDDHNTPVQMIGTIQDITERRHIQDSLLKLSIAVEQSPNSIVITDLDGNIEYVNTMFTTLTGYTKEEAFGKNPRILKSNQTSPSTYNDMWEHLTQGKIWHGELINQRKDKTTYIEAATISPVKQPNGKITHYLAIKENITDKKHAEEHIEYLAHYDQLTGLPNRIVLNDRITYLLNHAQRNDETIAVMFLDLDHFKNINDTLGHTIGDRLLIEIAQRLKSAIRGEDTVSRLGGDEFILLFPDTDANGAVHIATKLIEAVSIPSTIEQHELTITPSIGIALYPHDGNNFETLLKNADTAMYQAKNASRNAFHFFTQEMQLHSARNLLLVNALRHALERNELILHYQPQISTIDGSIIGVEALLRWNHPELGMISPAEFIPIAEDSGQIIPIGEWVLRTAIRQTKIWQTIGFGPMLIAVNLSAVQFQQKNLIERITTILDETQLPYEYLELELTEAITMHDPQSAINVMNTLHELGIRMSIDDFGTGYSSLSYLKQFKVYKLKIDQSFIRTLTDNPEDQAIVKAIIDMSKSLGLKTIAEGVETAEQLALLHHYKCDEIQGYYYSKPLPADAFEIFYKNSSSFVPCS